MLALTCPLFNRMTKALTCPGCWCHHGLAWLSKVSGRKCNHGIKAGTSRNHTRSKRIQQCRQRRALLDIMSIPIFWGRCHFQKRLASYVFADVTMSVIITPEGWQPMYLGHGELRLLPGLPPEGWLSCSYLCSYIGVPVIRGTLSPKETVLWAD